MTHKRTWIYALLVLFAVALTGAISTAATAQELDPTCTDGIDNNDNGLIDLTDPSCQTLSEEPAVTATPVVTDAPAVTAEPTAAPTDEPSPTASTLPDTGGDPGDDDTTGDNPNDPQFTEWLAQTSVIGIVTSFLVMVLGILGITATPLMKRIAAVVIALTLTVVYVSIQNTLAIKSAEDVYATVISVLVTSQVAYLLAAKEIGARVAEFRKPDAT